MTQHMRTLLLDPKWKTDQDRKRKKELEDSVFLDDVGDNLGSFKSNRPDLFGTVEEQIAMAKEAGEEASRKEDALDAGSAYTV